MSSVVKITVFSLQNVVEFIAHEIERRSLIIIHSESLSEYEATHGGPAAAIKDRRR